MLVYLKQQTSCEFKSISFRSTASTSDALMASYFGKSIYHILASIHCKIIIINSSHIIHHIYQRIPITKYPYFVTDFWSTNNSTNFNWCVCFMNNRMVKKFAFIYFTTFTFLYIWTFDVLCEGMKSIIHCLLLPPIIFQNHLITSFSILVNFTVGT